MKRALKINLSGRIFHIDEDAYEKLKIYLDTRSSHFSNIEDSKEIIDDIESRIAELLSELLSDDSQVINLSQVDEIIDIMGRPEEIVDDEVIGESKKREYYSKAKQNRKLYRDPDNSVFGGVAAGISAYFGVDMLLIRILFVVFILAGFGFPLVLYLVLWVAIPKAETPAEKLEMHGEKVNVSNLEKKVKEEYEEVKENLKKARNSKAAKRTEDAFSEIFRVLGVIIIGFFKIILGIIAVGFVIAGISLILSLLGVAFFGAGMGSWGLFHLWDTEIQHYIVPFVDPVNLTLFGIAGILVVLIPVLSIIYGLFKAIFRFKAKDKVLGMAAFTLWIIALVTVVSVGVSEVKNYKYDEEVLSSVQLTDLNSDTLYIMMSDYDEDIEDREYFNFNDQRYFISSNENVYGEIQIDLRESETEFFELEIERGAKGKDYDDAIEFAENIIYDYKIENNVLNLSPYFNSEYMSKWRFQTVEATIYVPEGKAIIFENKLSRYIDYVRSEQKNGG